MSEDNDSPVANGLVALVAVALVIGLLAAIIALIGTRLVGLTGGDGSSSGDLGAGDSLSLPPLQPTELDSGLLITLAPSDTAGPSESAAPLGIGESATPSASASASPSASASSFAPATSGKLTLGAANTRMKVGEELMLSGTYKGGEGAVLAIFYNVNDKGWAEFNVNANVYGGVFQVFVSTYQRGTIVWRVEDPANGLTSNEVTVHYDED